MMLFFYRLVRMQGVYWFICIVTVISGIST